MELQKLIIFLELVDPSNVQINVPRKKHVATEIIFLVLPTLYLIAEHPNMGSFDCGSKPLPPCHQFIIL